jgi:integrase
MHDLRRTFCSLLLEAGATVPYVMDQAGHKDPQVTLRIYASVLKRSPDIGKRVDALLKEAGSQPEGASIAIPDSVQGAPA